MLKKTSIFAGILYLQLLSLLAHAQQNEEQTWQSEDGNFRVSYESQLNPVVINQIHSWVLHVTRADGQPVSNAVITVKGGMPEHNHGLATSPSISASGDGTYLLQGLRFHMMGYWELELNISQGGISDTVIVTLDI